MAVTFSYINIPFRPKQAILRKIWLEKELVLKKKFFGQISYFIVNDTFLRRINKKYLNRSYFTDVISFDYSVGNIVSAEIFISIEQVKRNAKEFKCTIQNELDRVMVHGLLHCMDFDDLNIPDKKRMTLEEDKALRRLEKCLKTMI